MGIQGKNYSLVVLGCCFTIFVMMIGMANATSSLFIVPVSEAYGFSRSSFSITLSFSAVAGMLVNFFYCKIYHRFGVRRMIAIGFGSATIAFIVLAQATTLPLFYLGGLLAGVGIGLNGTTTVAILINGWFEKKQGTLLGIVAAGSGVGGFLFSALFVKIIAEQGYQMAYFITALCLFVIAIPLVIFIKEKPATELSCIEKKKKSYESSFKNFRRLLKNRPIRLTFIATFFMGLTVHSVLVATPGHLLNSGIDSISVGTLFGSIYLVLAVAKILLGGLNDFYGIKKASIVAVLAFLISATILIFVNSLIMAWVFVILFALAVAAEMVLVPLFARNVLTNTQYNNYLGMYMAALTAGWTIGMPIINFSYDTFGTYIPAIILYIIIMVLTLFMLTSSLTDKDKKIIKTAQSSRDTIIHEPIAK